ncbi:MAG: tetratricopeptide repeat protein [Coleofasciculus chthonoplastes F3-SA18-01]|uniref:tetratricopeptide repeat protein n=1 Tax=Coleofasciculus chthonoplastes TaxID=64178 RepID=UPI0032F9F5B8
MFKLLAKVWRWLKRWFMRQPPPPPPPPTQPSDLNYENVVFALLAEVAQGKTWGQLQAFLINRNVNQQRLAAWLEEFGQRWLAQPEVHQELARRLRRLAEGATGELARVARELAEGLLVVPEPDNSVITESAISGGNEQGASLSEVEKLNQLLAGLNGSGYNQKSVPVSNSSTVSDAEFWFNQGVTLYELGRYEEALANFDQLISLQPNDYQAWFKRGVVLGELGRYEKALANFDQVISLQPDDYQAWHNRGAALFKLGRPEEALANFDRLISLQPDDYKTWDNRGIVLGELGRHEEALANFDQVISLQPDDYQAWHNRGVALGELGRYEKALTSYDQAISIQPDYYQAWFNRSIMLGKLGRYREALTSYDQVISLQPDYYPAWYNRGAALGELGRYEEALANFDQVISLQPDYYPAWDNRGVVLGELGRYEEALANFDQAISLQPDYYPAWDNRGAVLFKLGRYEEVLTNFDQAVSLQPDYYQAWRGKGIALGELGRYEEALANFDQAISLQPDYYPAWDNRGLVLIKLGRYREALTSYDQAISLQPDYYQAWLNRSVMLSNLGRYEEALTNDDQVISLQPDDYQAWHNRGAALMELGRYEEALANFDQAISLRPDDYQGWEHRGIALGELGRHEEALASYDQAISLQPDYYKAWSNRGIAAMKSFGCESYWQKYFAACFHLEYNKVHNVLIPTLQNANRERHLALFQVSLHSSIVLLQETFADSPKVIVQLEQPPSPKLSQLILQPPSKTLIDLIQKPLSEEIIAKIAQDSLNHSSLTNPQLNLRGYEGAIASFKAPLDKAIRRDTHPEGWGVLHHQTGRVHYFKGQQSAKPYSFWRKAKTSYKTALQTLKPPEFEELHLEVLQDLIRVLLNIGEIEEARELQRQGADLLQRLLADPKRTTPQKQQLALKSALFNQLTVDLAIQSGDISGALTLAETGKNTCLRWFLGYEEVPELDYRQIQRLLTPTTAAIYWHLSPSALTTFVILPDDLQVVLTQRNAEGNAEERRGFIELNDQRSESLQHVLAWEKWLTEWNQRYQAYGSSKETVNGTEKKQHPWRLQMVESFQELRAILNISGIIEHLQNQPIENLILIPHRDLHRFPLHYFFPNYTCTYLPSAYSKLRLILEDEENRDDGGNLPINDTLDNCPPLHSLLLVENPKSRPFIQGKATPLSDLPFAEVEAALIRQLFSQVTLIANPNATRESLCQSLQTPHHVFHFTGHGAYNSGNPAQSCLFLDDTDQLTLTDIIHRDLRDYYLACLCACETAMTGDETITDEYVGLVSAFLKAGVTYVISPLWTVESAASALLIVKFYQHLEAGQSPPMALKSAQGWLKTATRKQLVEWLDRVIPQLTKHKSLQLILQDQRDLLDRMENNDPPYCHPYYWAAFTISGIKD